MDETLRLLLLKYMDHVAICEGVDFIADHHRRDYDMRSDDPWTDEEWAMLKAIGDGEPVKKPAPDKSWVKQVKVSDAHKEVRGELHSCG